MRFEHTATREDGGGRLTITAEIAAEVKELSDHFKLHDTGKVEDLLALAAAIRAGTLTHTSKPDKRLWFACESALDHRFTEPYEKLLQSVTGFEGSLTAAIDLTPHIDRLRATLVTDYLRLEHGHFAYRVFIQSEEWNGKDAATRADASAEDYTAELVGYRRHEPEYKEGKNGAMYRNPDYLKHHRAEPATGNPQIWAAIFAWWRATHATEGQRAILAAAEALSPGRAPGAITGYPIAHLQDHVLYVADDAGKVDWDGKGRKARVVTWDEFKAAK